MNNKTVNTETASNRRSVSRNLFPLRNNSIRGTSLNHSGIAHQLTKSHNSQSIQNG